MKRVNFENKYPKNVCFCFAVLLIIVLFQQTHLSNYRSIDAQDIKTWMRASVVEHTTPIYMQTLYMRV